MKIPFAKAMSPAMNHALTRWLALCQHHRLAGQALPIPDGTGDSMLHVISTNQAGTFHHGQRQLDSIQRMARSSGFYQADMSNPSSSTQVAHSLNAIALQLHAAYLMPGAHRRLPHTGTSLAHDRLLVAADPHRRPWNLDTSRWHLVLQHWSLTTHCLPLAA